VNVIILPGNYRHVSATHVAIFREREEEYRYNCTGKAIPLQAWTGPEGSRRLRLPDFKTIGT
jgi:hypothetical protein